MNGFARVKSVILVCSWRTICPLPPSLRNRLIISQSRHLLCTEGPVGKSSSSKMMTTSHGGTKGTRCVPCREILFFDHLYRSEHFLRQGLLRVHDHIGAKSKSASHDMSKRIHTRSPRSSWSRCRCSSQRRLSTSCLLLLLSSSPSSFFLLSAINGQHYELVHCIASDSSSHPSSALLSCAAKQRRKSLLPKG